jgi:hypothetical protein
MKTAILIDGLMTIKVMRKKDGLSGSDYAE